MTRVTRNEVDFSEIFDFAKEYNGMEWNTANDVFFNSEILEYKRHNDFNVSELEGNIKYHTDEGHYKRYPDMKRAEEVILAYMKKHKLEDMRVYND